MRYTVTIEPSCRLEFLAKSKGKLKPINRERAAAKKCRVKMKRIFSDYLESAAESVVKQLESIEKADDTDITRILGKVKLEGLVDLYGDISDVLSALAADGAVSALIQVGITDDAAMFTLVNERAIKWANEHAAEMVGKKLIDDHLVDNPNAAWQIEDSTRDMLRGTVSDALDGGWSNQRLAEAILENTAFSDSRAEMIARTETAFADVEGNVIAYRESGLVKGKEWLTAEDDKVSDECQANEEQGEIDFEDAFSSGEMWPPNHPNCRCDFVPTLIEQDN